MSAPTFVRLWSRTRLLLVTVASGLFGAGLVSGVPGCRGRGEPVLPGAVDARFITLGRTYLPALGRIYAGAWNEGAGRLEDGQPVPAALEGVAMSLNAGRTGLFDRLVSPEFSGLVPEGKPDVQTSRAEKSALARAWRGFATGLDQAAN